MPSRVWYGIHPDELNDTYAIRLYLDVCGLLSRGDTSHQYLFTLLTTRTLPLKKIKLRNYSGTESLESPCLEWPLSDVSLQRRIADIMDWQAICRSETLGAELLHSIRTYGLWNGGSADLYAPTDEDSITSGDILRYVHYIMEREDKNREKVADVP